MSVHENKAWFDILDFPNPDRVPKPRQIGVTMVIDKGLGLTETHDLLELASDYIDQIKLTFGTSAFYDRRLLKQKIELVKSYGVHIFPGGTFLELALLQGRLIEFLDRARSLGFTGVEISDGTINIDGETRSNTIKLTRAYGFDLVVSEVGKKDPRDLQPDTRLWEQVRCDLASGADLVIVEGRESGQGVVIYDEAGEILEEELDQLVRHLDGHGDQLLWEAPRKSQQLELIMRFGANVNVGNIKPEDVLALEALRVGVRGDTLRQYYLDMAGVQPITVKGGFAMLKGGEPIGTVD